MSDIIFSGVQPSGQLHLGNYLGAIKHWQSYQDKGRCLYSIVDLHAMTVAQNKEELQEAVHEVAAAYLASGLDPQKSILFVQSAVGAHAQLQWLLACQTPLGWLNRMTQFKEKAGKHREEANLGLYAYPVLMAADVLLYRTTHVPVGEDQKQHLELARNIAGAFNRHYEEEFFPLPEPMIQKTAARIMSLRDGTRKMSKSEPSEQSRIHLRDDADSINLKIKRAKTDSDLLPTDEKNLEHRPEARNLLTLFASISDMTLQETCAKWGEKDFSSLKKELSERIIAHLAPITKEMNHLLDDRKELDDILDKGARKAQEMAQATMKDIHHLMGLSH